MRKYNYLLTFTVLILIILLFTGCSVDTVDSYPLETIPAPEETMQAEVEEVIEAETEEPINDNSSDWSKSTHSNDVEPNYEIVFNQSEVLTFNIVIESDDWQAMKEDAKENFSSNTNKALNNKNNNKEQDIKQQETAITEDSNPIWVTSTITFNGITWEHVGIRFKGNSSLRSVITSGNNKFSFKLDFDQFEDEYPEIDNQRFYGFKQLNLNNNYSDETLLHDKVAADLFREFGIAAANTAFCAVNVDYGEGSQFFGVYTLVEEMDDTGIENQFGEDSGNLYKPEGKGATFAAGSFDEDDMVLKNNEDEADYSDVLGLYDVINSDDRNTDYESWKSDLEDIFNVDGFLKWLAANTVMQNWDTYGISPHNYYLYNDNETDTLNWIPWDNNEAFVSSKKDRSALSLGLDEVGYGWPIIRHIMDDSDYKAVYDGYLQQFIDEVFIPEKMIEIYNAHYEMIKEYAYAERAGCTFIKSDESFDEAIEDIKDHVSERNTAVIKYLNK